jgi:hypothetical protein
MANEPGGSRICELLKDCILKVAGAFLFLSVKQDSLAEEPAPLLGEETFKLSV